MDLLRQATEAAAAKRLTRLAELSKKSLKPLPTWDAGYDSSGRRLVQTLGQDPVAVGRPISTGAIGMGDRTYNIGNAVDVIPHIKPVPPAVVKKEESGNVKILFSVLEGSERVYYVGGDRPPREIYRIPSSRTIASAHLSNLGRGKNDWIAGLKYPTAPRGGDWIATITPNGVFTQTNEISLDWGAQLNWRGQGFWASQTGTQIQTSYSRVRLPIEYRPINPPVPPGVLVGDPFFYVSAAGVVQTEEKQARLYYSYRDSLGYTIQTLSLSDRSMDFADNQYARATFATSAQITPSLAVSASQNGQSSNPGDTAYPGRLLSSPLADPYVILSDVVDASGVFARSLTSGGVELYLATKGGTISLDPTIYSNPAWISPGESLSDFSKITLSSGVFYRIVFGEGLTQSLNPAGKITVDSIDPELVVPKKISAKFFPVKIESAVVHDASYHP